MDFIKFESARDKERIRQQLREARDKMLDQAKLRREERLQREAAQEPRGETNRRFNEPKGSKKKRKVKAKKSKSKGKHIKKRKKYTSSESDPDTSEIDSDDSSSDDEPVGSSKKKKKREKKKEYSSSGSDTWDMPSDDSSSEDEKEASSKSTSKKQKKSKESTSTSTSGSDSSDSDSSSKRSFARCKSKMKLKRHTEFEGSPKDCQPIPIDSVPERDSWMTQPLPLSRYCKGVEEKRSSKEQNYEVYDPSKSTRELNPYWKTTGTGLPDFKKPSEDHDDDSDDERLANAFISTSEKVDRSGVSKNWRKADKKETASLSIYGSESSDGEEVKAEKSSLVSSFFTDQQMNELGAKLVKAEIMGNDELAAKLKLELENARKNRAAFIEGKLAQSTAGSSKSIKKSARREREDEHVLLTHTDERGNVRPLAKASRTIDERDLYGGRNARRKQKRLETHADGERMRYFPDDDKYDIKQMFEREKYTSASDANLEFAKIAGKHKNPNDNLDDIFADEVRKDIPQSSTDRKEMQRAITEHQRLTEQLDNCRFCFESQKMDKSLLISMGKQVYLALPWHIGMQPGHCIISTTQHNSCCTQLDEDTWSEVNDFFKALTRMFAAQKKDVVFFEIASRLSRRPHLSIHCVPIPDEQAEMAPFYFKKAVEESELEWSVNKQLISLGRDGKGLRNCIPKGLPYFWVNFGMGIGFAHVIEDEDRFPPNFALEIIGGMLELDARKWRRPQKEQNSIAKANMFAGWWKKFDCTK
ncbi:CWF19-like protein 2 homolog [Anastrepha obliqua]|uniref:CWF19-like protein 2 homolog n=1 Tax=Anastrepha obliqua TaxID=95512 RepID=UPI002409828A|nr:CWF19-like protein 2 homolog [Anastrepha obliqua]